MERSALVEYKPTVVILHCQHITQNSWACAHSTAPYQDLPFHRDDKENDEVEDQNGPEDGDVEE